MASNRRLLIVLIGWAGFSVFFAAWLLVISWSTVLGAVYRSGSGDLMAQLIGLAYPAGDVVIGTMLVVLAARAPRSTRLPLYLLAGGLLANLLADSGFAYLTTTSQYGAGSVIDVGWAA